MYKTREVFLYWGEGYILTKEEEDKFKDNIPNWLKANHIEQFGDDSNELQRQEKTKEVSLDLDGDGDIDGDDAKIASKVMNAVRKKKRASRKKATKK